MASKVQVRLNLQISQIFSSSFWGREELAPEALLLPSLSLVMIVALRCQN